MGFTTPSRANMKDLFIYHYPPEDSLEITIVKKGDEKVCQVLYWFIPGMGKARPQQP